MQPRSLQSTSKDDNKSFICDVCSTTFSSKSRVRTHMYLHFSDGVHTCDQCPKKPMFHHSQLFRRHVKRVHCAIKPHKCEHCSESFKTKSRLDSHKIKHSNIQSFRCTYCSRRFKRKHILRSHIDAFHNSTGAGNPRTGRAVLICDLCGKTFAKKSNLRRHLYTHYPDGQFFCDTCGKIIEHSKLYEVHKKICVAPRPAQKRSLCRYYCDRCDKGFLTKFGFESHIVIHSAARNFHCTQCPKRFKRKRHLQLHLRTVHAKKRNVVPTEPKKCTNNEVLYRTEGELSCITCCKIFPDIESFDIHFSTFHDPNTAKWGKERRNFRCEHCDVIYLNKRGFEEHNMISHYYEKNVECDYCTRRFKNKADLEDHVRNGHLEEQRLHTVLLIMCDEKFEKIIYQEARILHDIQAMERDSIY